MAATYDSSLGDNVSIVRFLIQDTDTSSASMSDEEITALLGLQTATGAALPYFAAAEALSILSGKWSAKGAGVLEKQVSKLRLKFGRDSSAAQALDQRIEEIRRRGAFLLKGAGARHFKAL